MHLLKVIKDSVLKPLRPGYVPEGVVEWINYARHHGGINFRFEKKDGVWIAKSTNFRYGSIITSGKDEGELDKNIRDAILTAFEIPSVYASKAAITREGERTSAQYVAA